MWYPLFSTIIIATAFIGYWFLTEREVSSNRRFFLSGWRRKLDDSLVAATNRIEHFIRYIIKYVITLSWYYSLHALLKLILRSIAGVYQMLETILIRNRERARALRKERRTNTNTHLSKIADHKEQVKLSPAEETKRKQKALKGN